MNRRRFLQTLLAALATTVLPAGAADKGRTENLDAIVIGAGLAGLAAARTLAARGYNVLTLEGRGRLGGRVHTDETLGFPIDLGASYIHGLTGNPMTQLAREARLTICEIDYDDVMVYDEKGRRVPADTVEKVGEVFYRLQERIPERLDSLGIDRSAHRSFAKALEGAQLDPLEQRVFAWFMRTQEDEMATDLANLSARHQNHDEAFKGADALLRQGFAQIVRHVSDGLAIELGAPVTRVDATDPHRLTVTAGGREYRAGHVVVTLPLGVLKQGSVEFRPALPAAKTQAIAQLGVGTVNKAALRFTQACWPTEPHYFGFLAAERPPKPDARSCVGCHGEPDWRGDFLFSNVLNLAAVYQQPILIGHCPASLGAAMESQSDAANLETVKRILRTAFRFGDASVTKAVFSRWHLDPYALGGYPYLRHGTHPRLFDVLAEPVGTRLHFAGDATSRAYPSTVHGAWHSGIRAAREIIDAD